MSPQVEIDATPEVEIGTPHQAEFDAPPQRREERGLKKSENGREKRPVEKEGEKKE